MLLKYWKKYALNLEANILQFLKAEFVRTAARTVDDAQTLTEEINANGGGNNPSHTQLAKDDHEKPLHDLSAKLGEYAVRKVGEEMNKRWQQRSTVNIEELAASFIYNPSTESMAFTNDLERIASEWARNNADKMALAGDRTVLDTLAREANAVVTRIQQLNTAIMNSAEDARRATAREVERILREISNLGR